MATEATIKAGIQSAKGTAKTSGLICARLLEIEQDPDYEYSEDEFEYSCTGVVDRPTARKSFATMTGYTVGHNYVGNLYPDFIGVMLLAAGFQVVTTADTPESGANRHVFTLGSATAAKWATILRTIGSGAAFDTRSVDNRITSLAIADSRQSVRQTIQGQGLTQNLPAGTETHDAEDAVKIQQLGFFTVTHAAAAIIDTTAGPPKLRPYQSHTLTINNPQETEEGWYQTAPTDLSPSGLDIVGNIQGVEVDFELYKRIDWGGASGTGPNENTANLDVNYKLQSASNIPTTSTPYSIEFDFPNCEGRRDGRISVRGGEKIRMNLAYYMVDSVTTPVTITLINGVSAYV